MNEQELLREILDKLGNGQKLLQQEVAGLTAGQESLQSGVSELQSNVASLQENQLKINIKLENEIGQKLSALFDGHQLDSERIQ